MTWARPDLYWLLLLVPLALAVAIGAERRRRRDLAAFAALDIQFALVGRGVARARGGQAALAAVAALALAVAALGPRLGFEWQQQTVEGVSIVVVLDVSRSMDAQDVQPSRLEVARREVSDFLSLLRGDAVGLVVFAAGPYVRIPLTVDYDTFRWALDDSSSDTIRAQGSSLAGALDAATRLLGKASGAGKAVLLVSDGEGHDAGPELDAAVAAASAAGVRVYTLGVGDPSGAPIPLAGGGFKKDSAGNVVVSRLDEDALKRLASATGGAYVRAVASDEDVRALYLDEIRGKLDAAERGIRREKLWHERYQWPLAAALLAMCASAALGIGRRRGAGRPTSLAASLLLAGALLGWAPSALAGAREDGMAALTAGQWARAAELLGQARVRDPADLDVTRALGEALYRAGRYRESEQIFRTLTTQDPTNKAVHLYNVGNAAYRGGRLADAARAYRDAIAADPSLRAAQTNATAVEKEIAARTDPPPQDDQGQGGQQGADATEDGQAGADASPNEASPSGGSTDPPGAPGPTQDGARDAGGEPGAPSPTVPSPDAGPPGGDAAAEAANRNGAEAEGRPTDDDVGRRDGVASPEGSEPGEPGPDGPVTSVGGQDGASPDGAEGAGGAGGGDEMTAEQASRLVDSVPDGTPRVVVGGDGTEKDW